MLKRKFLSVLLPALALGLVTSSQAEIPTFSQQLSGPVYFFEQTLPTNLKAADSEVKLSQDVYRDGESSLQWNFNNGATLTFNVPFEYKKDDITPVDFTLWVYVDKADSNKGNKLVFKFKQDDKVAKEFSLDLNFSGWRGLNVPYRDISGGIDLGEQASFTSLEVKAEGQGKVYLDQMMLTAKIDNRWATPDLHQPFVGPDTQTSVNRHWNALITFDKYLKDGHKPFDYSAKFSDTGAKVKDIYKNIDTVNDVNPDLEVKQEDVDALLAEYKKFDLVEKDGRVVGPRLEFPTHLDILKDKQNLDADTSKEVNEKFTNLRTLGQTMLKTAKLLSSTKLSAENRKSLEAEYLKSLNFILDQGFTYGSTYQIIHHLGYQNRELFSSLFLMRNLLAENNLLEPVQKTMAWYTGLGRIFEKDINQSNVDVLNTQLQWMLESILLLPNETEKEAMLEQFSSWLSTSLVRSKGTLGGFKDDGTTFHHRQHYPAYGIDALRGLSPTVYMISGTPYGLTAEALATYKNTLKAFVFFTKGVNIPIALSGRHPTENFKLFLDAFKWGALSNYDGTGKGDKELSAIYARLTGLAEFNGVAANVDPVGIKVYPWSSSLVVRANGKDEKESWLAIARGYSRYLPGNEAYGANNLYSRNSLNGKFEFIPTNFDDRPYRHDGFDWRHYDGTTAIYQSFADLKSKLVQLPKAGEEEMLLSDQTYSGVNKLNNKVASFGQIVHGHAKYNQENFWAYKSYFVFGNSVVALGSNIQSDDSKNPVHTTLTQQFMKDDASFSYNGTNAELGKEVTLKDGATLVSPSGVTYYVPKDANLVVTLNDQETPDDRNDKPTKGRFVTAYLDHGTAVKDGTYEYSMVLEPAKDQGNLDYKVLRQDNKAHVVTAPQFKATGYNLFKAGDVNVGKLVSVSASSMVLMEEKDKALAVSFVNPDLALYKGVEADQVDKDGKQLEVSAYSRSWTANDPEFLTTTYVFDGEYKLASNYPMVKVSVENNKTTVKVTASGAKVVKVELVPAN